MLTIDSLLGGGAPPIVAILRGVKSDEAVAIAAALIDAGVRIIETPLNSPDPFSSIAAMQTAFGDRALIGAGTVLDEAAVDALAATGARLMVSPDTRCEVIERGLAKSLEVMPGVLTPSEAFTAIRAGARRLKLFPATAQGQAYLTALREVLPSDVGVWAVGGVSPANFGSWLEAGAEGVGVGGAVYRPGDEPDAVAARARALVQIWRSATIKRRPNN